LIEEHNEDEAFNDKLEKENCEQAKKISEEATLFELEKEGELASQNPKSSQTSPNTNPLRQTLESHGHPVRLTLLILC
jgi:hypothetical protein